MNRSFAVLCVVVVLFVAAVIFLTQGNRSGTVSQLPVSTPSPLALSVIATPEASPSGDISMLITPTVSQSHVKQYSAPPAIQIDKNKTYTATITTSKGTMVINLFAKEVPVTVNNFVFLARDGFYNNTIFHRIIKGFMIQGGDPEGTGRGGPGYKFNDEPISRAYSRGVLAMANAGPNTNGSQFFIMHEDNPLPKNYVIFGMIDSSDSVSLKTLDTIANTPVTDNGMGEQSQPTETVSVETIAITEK
jgi:cyclophilin family peptidyl-prolyl cis-trans isomerase